MAARCLLSVCASLLLRPVESFTLHPVVSGARAPSLSLCRPPLASAHLRSSRRLATLAPRAANPTPHAPPPPTHHPLPCALQHVKVGSGASSICGDNSGALTWRQLGTAPDAVYADVDTDSCSFPDVPVYVASLVESEPQQGGGGGGGGGATKTTAAAANSGVSRSAGSVTVTAHAVGSFRVVLWDPQFILTDTTRSHRGGDAGALLDAMAARRWTVDWVGDTGSNSGVTLAGQTEWKEMPPDTDTAAAAATAASAQGGKDDQVEAAGMSTTAEVTDKNAGVLYVDVDTRACGFDTAPAYFVSLNGGESGRGAALSNSMAAVHGVEYFRTQGAAMVYAARPGGFRVYVTAARWRAPAALLLCSLTHSLTRSLAHSSPCCCCNPPAGTSAPRTWRRSPTPRCAWAWSTTSSGRCRGSGSTVPRWRRVTRGTTM